MSRRLVGAAMALAVWGCATQKQPALVRLVPAGVEEKPLVAQRLSRMGFEWVVGASTTIRFGLPENARGMRIGCCIPKESGSSATFQGTLRRADGDSVVLFRQKTVADEWYEAVVPVSGYAGETVTLVLSSVESEGSQESGRVYWSTPTVITEGGTEPCVLLISIDSLRADHLGCYGYSRDTTPHIDSLATTGFVFANCIAQSSWTLPSHASLLTSLFVKTHGACGAQEGVSPDALVIAEELRRCGYATAAFVSGPFLLPRYGMNQGFDLYDARCSSVEHGDSHHDVTNPCLHRRATEWLRDWSGAPFFLFLHYWDVHYDYVPPAPYDTLFDPNYRGDISGRNFAKNERVRQGMPQRDLEHLIALYDGEIACTDAYLGSLFAELAELGIAGKTLVVVTSDHGDEFLEHGATGHGHTLYQELIRVPLIWAEPGGAEGPLRVDDVVQLVDITPSILGYLGRKPPKVLEGRSFLPRLRGAALEPRAAFSETRSGGFLKAVVGADTKIIRAMLNAQTRAYDLRTDPTELRPVPPESLPGAPALGRALDQFLEEGRVSIELRVVGLPELSGGYDLRLVMTDPPLEVHAQGLEGDDSLEVVDLPPEVSLRLLCGVDDVDGVTVVLPSSATTLRVIASREGVMLNPEHIRLGMAATPDRTPVELSAGDSRLRVPPTNVPALPGGGPPVVLWKVDTRALATTKVELDGDLSERLRALGYLQ
jgi:arylsulfatase A-like enzyme